MSLVPLFVSLPVADVSPLVVVLSLVVPLVVSSFVPLPVVLFSEVAEYSAVDTWPFMGYSYALAFPVWLVVSFLVPEDVPELVLVPELVPLSVVLFSSLVVSLSVSVSEPVFLLVVFPVLVPLVVPFSVSVPELVTFPVLFPLFSPFSVSSYSYNQPSCATSACALPSLLYSSTYFKNIL